MPLDARGLADGHRRATRGRRRNIKRCSTRSCTLSKDYASAAAGTISANRRIAPLLRQSERYSGHLRSTCYPNPGQGGRSPKGDVGKRCSIRLPRAIQPSAKGG